MQLVIHADLGLRAEMFRVNDVRLPQQLVLNSLSGAYPVTRRG